MLWRKENIRKTTLAEILKGTVPGRIQSSGYMQVIPLVSDLVDERFVSPEKALVSTVAYGSMEFENPSEEQLLIIPLHAGYVVEQQAQDHALGEIGLLKPRKKRVFHNAMCVQATQGGLIQKNSYDLTILPYSLRESALGLRKKKEYNKLWEDISQFNKEMGLERQGNLEFFLKGFKREIAQFIAEFECLEKQVGAIVLIDDIVVGIERGPNYEYWSGVWPALIRESYGSLAIQVGKIKGENAPPPESRIPLKEDIGSLEELSEALEEVCRKEDENTRNLVRELLDVPLRFKSEDKTAGLRIETILGGKFSGQVVRDGNAIVYASMVIKKKFRNAQTWGKAAPFDI